MPVCRLSIRLDPSSVSRRLAANIVSQSTKSPAIAAILLPGFTLAMALMSETGTEMWIDGDGHLKRHRFHRAMMRSAARLTYNRVQASALFMPLLFTLITNLRQRRRGLVVVIGVPVLFVAFFIVKDVLLGRRMVHADGYAYLPAEGGALAVEPGYYADQRDGAPGESSLPEIQSDMVRDPYVRLFIPYRPRRHNALIARRCPGVRADASPTAAGNAAVLRCLAALQPVTLNGKPLQPAFRFYTHPGTGFRGIVAYIPTAGLPKGENVLSIAQLAIPDPTPAEAAVHDPPYSIPFWL